MHKSAEQKKEVPLSE
ncbi:Protein of unknown function [Bacillus mycoides]|nr:Protein of unknown function [Bacillus mycoides]